MPPAGAPERDPSATTTPHLFWLGKLTKRVGLNKTRQIEGRAGPLQGTYGVYGPFRVAIARDSGVRTKPRIQRFTLLWLPLIVCAVLCGDVLLRNRSLLRADLLARISELLPGALAALAVAGLAVFLASAPQASETGSRAAARRFGALLCGPLSTLPVLFLARHHPAARAAQQVLDRWGFPCFFLAYLVAALSLVVLARDVRSRSAALTSWRSAALASVAGTWSSFALLLHCPGAELEHLVVGHVLPIALLPLVGLLLAERCLRRS